MVGIPRSRGCRTCVQRRVRCDLKKPTCENCRKGNRDCNYAEDFKFQDEGAKLRRRFAKKGSGKEASELPTASPSPAIASPSFSPSDASEPLEGGALMSPKSLPDSSSCSSVSRVRRAPDAPLATSIPHYNAFFALLESTGPTLVESETSSEDGDVVTKLSLQRQDRGGMYLNQSFEAMPLFSSPFSPGLDQDQVFSLFQSGQEPTNQIASIPRPLRAWGNWLASLPSGTGKNLLLDSAIRALSLAHMGNLHGNHAILNQSRFYYGKAIRLLSAALSDPDTGMASETLSATMLLSYYEMLVSESNDSWIKHAGGVSALMKLRDPSRYRYGLDREIFLAYRPAIIIESFHKEVPCFLDQPAWTKVARDIYKDNTENITDEDVLELFSLAEEFYERIVQVPAFLADLKNLPAAYKRERASHSSPKDFLHTLLRRVVTSRTNLKTFFAKFEGCLMNLDYKRTSYESDDPLIPTRYSFPHIFVALFCTGYWNILMILNLMILEMQSKTGQERDTMLATENRECALEICRSTPYLLTSAFLGPLFCIFGLRTSLMVLQDASEREWVVTKLFDIGQTHMAMAMHIPGYDAEDLIAAASASRARRGKVEEMEQTSKDE